MRPGTVPWAPRNRRVTNTESRDHRQEGPLRGVTRPRPPQTPELRLRGTLRAELQAAAGSARGPAGPRLGPSASIRGAGTRDLLTLLPCGLQSAGSRIQHISSQGCFPFLNCRFRHWRNTSVPAAGKRGGASLGAV